jgi:hypothetical protein
MGEVLGYLWEWFVATIGAVPVALIGTLRWTSVLLVPPLILLGARKLSCLVGPDWPTAARVLKILIWILAFALIFAWIPLWIASEVPYVETFWHCEYEPEPYEIEWNFCLAALCGGVGVTAAIFGGCFDDCESLRERKEQRKREGR